LNKGFLRRREEPAAKDRIDTGGAIGDHCTNGTDYRYIVNQQRTGLTLAIR
jgi:hypothetical protein